MGAYFPFCDFFDDSSICFRKSIFLVIVTVAHKRAGYAAAPDAVEHQQHRVAIGIDKRSR